MNTAEKVYHDVLQLPEPLAQEVLQFVESLKYKHLPLKTKEDFIQEALDSYDSYQKTGLHLTGEEVRDWLATWGTDKERERPECHK